MLPEKGVLSAVVGTVYRWCLDYVARLEESSTGEVARPQNFSNMITVQSNKCGLLVLISHAPWSVSLCLLGSGVSPAKRDEPTEMQTRVGQRNHVLDGVLHWRHLANAID